MLCLSGPAWMHQHLWPPVFKDHMGTQTLQRGEAGDLLPGSPLPYRYLPRPAACRSRVPLAAREMSWAAGEVPAGWDGASCASASACPAESRGAGSSAPGLGTALGGGARAPPGGPAGAGSVCGAPGELNIRGGCGETKCAALTWSHSLRGERSGSMQDSSESSLLLESELLWC